VVKTIVVGTDGSETAEQAVDFAMEIAERFGAHLVVGSCYEPVPGDRLEHEQVNAPQEIKWSINPSEEVDAILRAAEEKAKERGLGVTSEARMGKPARVLCEIAAEHDADVLVVGNRGMNRRVRGSVPNTVSHHAPCSVVIVKTDWPVAHAPDDGVSPAAKL
jgi:nucleotide-binding universal stress UspA family protein